MKQAQVILWILFVISLPLRMYTNWFAFGALLSGVCRKNGFPKISKEYLQRVMLDENFQGIGYMLVVAMVGSVNFVVYVPLLLTAYIDTADSG